jgi:hypothetical protein
VRWANILAQPIPANAILVSNDRDEMMPMWYMQYVENTRRDLIGVFPLITPAHTNIARITDDVLTSNRPVYFIKPMPGIEIKYDLQSEPSGLVRVVAPAIHAPPQIPVTVTLGGRIGVVGYDAKQQQNELRLTIYWQAHTKIKDNYTAFVQIFSSRGSKIAQSDDHQVGGDYYPTSMWDVNEILRDEHMISIPSDTPPGTYRIFVGMYRQPDFDPLGDPQEMDWIDLR